MSFVGGIIHRTSEDIEHASINRHSLLLTEFPVQPFRAPPVQIAHRADSQVQEITGDGFADAGNGAKLPKGCILFLLMFHYTIRGVKDYDREASIPR